jgi:hypothetical protein
MSSHYPLQITEVPFFSNTYESQNRNIIQLQRCYLSDALNMKRQTLRLSTCVTTLDPTLAGPVFQNHMNLMPITKEQKQDLWTFARRVFHGQYAQLLAKITAKDFLL